MVIRLKHILLLTALFLWADVFSQQINFDWSPLMKRKHRELPVEFLGEDGDAFFMVKRRPGSVFSKEEVLLEKVSRKNLLPLFSRPLELPQNSSGARHEFERVVLVKGRLFLFTSADDPQTGRKAAWVHSLTPMGAVIPGGRKIDEIVARKKNSRGNFDFVVSAGNVLVYHNEPFEKEGKEKIAFTQLNDSMQVVFSKLFELPYADSEVTIRQYLSDTRGNLFLLTRILNRNKRENGTSAYYYTLFVLFRGEENFSEFPIVVKDKNITGFSLKILDDKFLVGAGFYSNKQDNESGMIGNFYVKIDLDSRKIVAQTEQGFEKNFLRNFLSPRQINRRVELQDFVLRDLITTPSGETVLIAEQYQVQSVCYTDPRNGMLNCNYYYYYNDIVVVRYDGSGTPRWYRRIPKSQVSLNDDGPYASYLVALYENSLYFVFNDNAMNVNRKKTDIIDIEPMDNVNRSVAVLVALDEAGETTKLQVFKSREQKVFLMPKVYQQSRPSEVLFYAQDKGHYKFGKIDFR